MLLTWVRERLAKEIAFAEERMSTADRELCEVAPERQTDFTRRTNNELWARFQKRRAWLRRIQRLIR